jgi:hypothetical protein
MTIVHCHVDTRQCYLFFFVDQSVYLNVSIPPKKGPTRYMNGGTETKKKHENRTITLVCALTK